MKTTQKIGIWGVALGMVLGNLAFTFGFGIKVASVFMWFGFLCLVYSLINPLKE